MFDDKLKIKVTIGDRVYPLTIKSEGEEEGIRKAVKKINDLIRKFEENYEVRDKQDVLAMCALQFASRQEVKSIYNVQDAEQLENKLQQLGVLLDAHL
ncbi:MAG: cell division protein ZapA [Flavobacteriaceae bacterium]|nr:cell division protein ZapA [Flavobacteriaceae bacterium]